LSLNPGGTERLVVELVRRLRPDVDMAVCCLDEAGSWGEGLRGDHIVVSALRRASGFRPALGHAIARIAAQHGATVIHCHHYSPFVYGCLARLWHPRLRVIFTEHGRLSDAPPSQKRRVANQLLSRAPREVVTVSSDLKRHLVAEGFPGEKVSVIYNGIDVGPLPRTEDRASARRQLGLADGMLAIGTVARLDSVKDLGTLIRGVAELRRTSDASLVVIGDGAERRNLEGLAGDLGIASAVRFLGHRENARDLLAGCDIYANSSISEGISLTILEAMAAGLPVVATRVGGNPEIIDAECGRLVPSRQPAAIAAALSELGADAGMRTELGRAARRRVEERFTLDRMVREYRDAYFKAA
jgi:glycosyltransferase involved in cell wall biosynthesis